MKDFFEDAYAEMQGEVLACIAQGALGVSSDRKTYGIADSILDEIASNMRVTILDEQYVKKSGTPADARCQTCALLRYVSGCKIIPLLHRQTTAFPTCCCVIVHKFSGLGFVAHVKQMHRQCSYDSYAAFPKGLVTRALVYVIT